MRIAGIGHAIIRKAGQLPSATLALRGYPVMAPTQVMTTPAVSFEAMGARGGSLGIGRALSFGGGGVGRLIDLKA